MSAKKGKGERKGSPTKVEVTDTAGEVSSAVDEDTNETVEKEAVIDESQGEQGDEAQNVTPNQVEPDPVYEEPILTQLIVKSYDGPVERGLYEGNGVATFVGGHAYEGQFSCGLMHGVGKYTWSDGTIYEGEFLQNRITGRGKLIWNDSSWYEGEVYDGLRHGLGKFTSPKTGMSYEGEWKMGNKHGKGLMKYDADGNSFYEGSWVENKKHGLGTRQFPSGNIYQGTWFNNERHGQGTMRWITHNQMYIGQWERGAQQGYGEHVWFFQRAEKSQYPMRNMYKGQLQNGMRHGFGAFFFANGAVYEGEWRQNKKHGHGKFIFKNGRVYEGIFDQDHILEYPTFVMDGMNTPDISQIKTRTPLISEQLSVVSNISRNTYGPSFQLDMTSLMEEFPESERNEEASQVLFVIMRHMSTLRAVYTFYSKLGFEASPDNTYIMSHMQFWRFLKDVRLHHYNATLIDMDRYLGADLNAGDDIHNPNSKILFREFINHLAKIAYFIFEEEKVGTDPVLAWCFSKMMTDNILKNACTVKGHVYIETQQSINALVHMDQAYSIYKSQLEPRKLHPEEVVLTMRQFLFMLKNLRLINNDLTPKKVIEILSQDDPKVADGEGCVNLELEMTFLEFFEALIGCAEVYITEAIIRDPEAPTPRPATVAADDGVPDVIGEKKEERSEGTAEGESVFQPPQTPIEEAPPKSSPQRRASQANKKTEALEKSPETRGSNKAATPDTERLGTRKSNTAGRDGFVKENSEMSLGDGKSAQRSGVQSGLEGQVEVHEAAVLVDPDGLEVGEEQTEAMTQEDGLSEETRQFNFWTHQVHIFFSRKFFPASEQYNCITNILKEKFGQPGRIPTPAGSSPVNDSDEANQSQARDAGSPAEQSEAEGTINEHAQHAPSIATASS